MDNSTDADCYLNKPVDSLCYFFFVTDQLIGQGLENTAQSESIFF